MSQVTTPQPQPHDVERAIKLSYAQAMLGAIYTASTGGMFLIGYALALEANNLQIGLMTSIPMCCVVVQLVSAAVIERGASRRRMTLIGGVGNVLGWALIILIPYAARGATASVRVGCLIAIIALVTLFGNISVNARGSWVGDLIPASFRGTFFGRTLMYAGIIGAVFALLEGRFLDSVKQMGIGAFSWLFAFGMLFGLANAALFVPQPDVPVARGQQGGNLLQLARETFANRPYMMVMIYALLWSLQAIAAPFYATYMLRDLKMPFLGLGLVNVPSIITMLASSPFWGRIVDRYGCRPVLVACTACFVPLNLVWIWLDNARAVYAVIPFVNLLAGFLAAGISVALTSMVYKMTPSVGRSVQFAIYAIIVTLACAPMPAIGGLLPEWLAALGIYYDLRATFYATIPFFLASALAAVALKEPDAGRTRDMVRQLPGHLLRPDSLHAGGDLPAVRLRGSRREGR